MDDIVLFQILPRLPNKSLGRFMCVCKQWQSFLTSPVFTKMHIHHVNNQNHHKLIVVSTTNPCNYFSTIDCETPEFGLSANRPLPFEVGTTNEMSIISSLNGLVCVGIRSSRLFGGYDNYLDIILWNPLTGDYKTLSKDNNCFGTRGYGLYYSSCDDDYKLLRVTHSSDAYIYSWKSDSWRKAKSTRVDSLMKVWHRGCLVNEKLYFLAQGTQAEMRSLIIRFDTKTEMFTEIATPSSCECFYMTVVGGCIHLCVIPKIDSDTRLELWKMDGNGEWTKVIRSCRLLCDNQPWHLMKNGNWLLHSIRKLYVFKVHRKEPNLKKARRHTIDRTMGILSRGTFVETIVSLKR